MPVVIPIYHLGMDSILKYTKPYIPRIGKKVTILIGDPIDISTKVWDLREKSYNSEKMVWIEITEFLKAKIKLVEKETQILHANGVQITPFNVLQ